MKVYLIPGLGADKRIFQFLDLSFCEPVFIEWIKPLAKETLPQYALRLKEQMPEENPMIIGVSFGGMLATEIAKSDQKTRAIIISSAKTCNALPRYFKLGKHLPVYKWLPDRLLLFIAEHSIWFLGAEDEEQKN